LIINADQEETLDIAAASKAKIVPFSSKRILESGAWIEDDALVFNGEKVIGI